MGGGGGGGGKPEQTMKQPTYWSVCGAPAAQKNVIPGAPAFYLHPKRDYSTTMVGSLP